jgi:hypothetical protein
MEHDRAAHIAVAEREAEPIAPLMVLASHDSRR